MSTNLDANDIQIPEGLTGAVECSLREVTRIHRSRIFKRAGMTAGCFALVLGALTAFGLANPALASQIPLIGGLFKQEAVNNKISAGNENVAGYGVVEEIKETAAAGESTITVEEGYSDGNRIQLAFTLEIPGITDAVYEKIYPAEIGKSALLTVNGTEVPCGLGPINYKDGKWQGFIEGRLPEALQGVDRLETALTLNYLEAREKPGEGERYSEENLPRYKALDAVFAVNFTVTADKAHEFSFSCTAEDNGAKVFGISGTPIQTVISVEKPYWGEMTPEAEDGAQGKPQLLTMDGKNVQQLYSESVEQGGYDRLAREVQTADLYFDGLPAGTKQIILRFHKSSFEDAGVLAEFLIDIETGTAVPSKTYQEGGALDLNSPYAYMSLQEGNQGELQNGVRVQNVNFNRWTGEYSGQVLLQMEAPLPESGYRVQLAFEDGNEVFAIDCTGAEGDGWSQHESLDMEAMQQGAEKTVYDLSVYQPVMGIEVPIGQRIVTTVTDIGTGEVLCTDTRSLTGVHRF